MIVMTVSLPILNQIEFHLVQNRKENCHHDHIPFNLKGNGVLIFSVKLTCKYNPLCNFFPHLVFPYILIIAFSILIITKLIFISEYYNHTKFIVSLEIKKIKFNPVFIDLQINKKWIEFYFFDIWRRYRFCMVMIF